MPSKFLTIKELEKSVGAALSYSTFIYDLHATAMPARLYGCTEWFMDAYVFSDAWWSKPCPRPVGF